VFASREIQRGIRRLTLPLPIGPRHVHCYLLSEPDGWMLVDTGLALPGLPESLVDVEVARIAVTHFHPDHVGGAGPAAAATGAPVHQGELDYAQCEQVWGTEDWPSRIAQWFHENGVPVTIADDLHAEGEAARPLIRYAPNPHRVNEGDHVGAWEVIATPGHADGHICLLHDGVLVSGDHLLPDITPAVGLYPGGRPDPLGDYLRSLERTIALAPTVALPGHGDPIVDPVARAHELLAHHADRLDRTAAALGQGPRSGYDVSLALFDDDLPPSQRRFAVAETLSHLEHLVTIGRARKHESDGGFSYTGP
jgi:glyoxylase-like metal-dependent hydrolase (beta-lactamase superfamily II)